MSYLNGTDIRNGKAKGKVHPRIGYERPEWE
jgi:hypothetical protein